MASFAERSVKRLHHAISAPTVILSSLTRKIFLAALTACLVWLLALQWFAVQQRNGGLTDRPRMISVPRQPSTTSPLGSASLAAANLTTLATVLPQSSHSMKGTTAALEDLTTKPRRRRLVLFWTSFWGASFKDIMKQSFPPSLRCSQLCELTYDMQRASEADALLFHAADYGWPLPAQRHANQLWVLYNIEPPTHGYVSAAHNGHFNLTMMYRSDSDIEAGYGHTETLNLSDSHSLPRLPSTLPPTLSAGNFTKRKPYAYWMVSNCKDARMKYVQELAKYIRVDMFGKCAPPGSRSCGRHPDAIVELDCEAELSASYAFNLAFENSLCPDYITEKLWRALASLGGAIPVVIGARPSRYAQVAPPGSFVHAQSFASPRDLAAHLVRVASSHQQFMSYHQWRERYRAHVGWYYELAHGVCRLCELMHRDKGLSRPAQANLFEWFNSGCATAWPMSHRQKETLSINSTLS